MSTLVVFARAPAPGFCKTRLAKGIGNEAAAQLYDAMLRDTIDRVSAMKDVRKVLFAAPEQDGERVLRTYVTADWHIERQPEGDLTARLAHAFSLGGPVACIGSDAPLSPFDALEQKLGSWASDVLMGPSEDGGYWCIGMKTLRRELLEGMPWSTSAVFEESLKRTKALGLSLATLPETFDIDEPTDIPALRGALAGRPQAAPRTAAVLEALSLVQTHGMTPRIERLQ